MICLITLLAIFLILLTLNLIINFSIKDIGDLSKLNITEEELNQYLFNRDDRIY